MMMMMMGGQNSLSHGCLLGRRGAAGDRRHEPRDRQRDLPAASHPAPSHVRRAAGRHIRLMLCLNRWRGRLYRRDRRRGRGVERCHRAWARDALRGRRLHQAVMRDGQRRGHTVRARRRGRAPSRRRYGTTKVLRVLVKVGRLQRIVAAEPDDRGSSFSCGAGMLMAANSSSAVGLDMNVARSSPRLRSASSNAEEPHIPGG